MRAVEVTVQGRVEDLETPFPSQEEVFSCDVWQGRVGGQGAYLLLVDFEARGHVFHVGTTGAICVFRHNR